MASKVIDDLVTQATVTEGVIDSACNVINGISGMIQAAVDQALANGATAEQLKPVTQVITDLDAKTDALAEAIAALNPPKP